MTQEQWDRTQRGHVVEFVDMPRVHWRVMGRTRRGKLKVKNTEKGKRIAVNPSEWNRVN